MGLWGCADKIWDKGQLFGGTHAPSSGSLKIDWDVALDSARRKTSIGIIVRESTGHVLVAASFSID
jgi:hypothetical protein